MSTPAAAGSLSVKDAYDMYNRHTESAHKLWAYYSAVSLAVMGFTFKAGDSKWSVEMFVWISVAYMFFALSNLWVLRMTQKECGVFAGVLNEVALAQKNEYSKILVTSASVNKVIGFHVFAMMAVVAAIFVSWHDLSIAKSKDPSKDVSSARWICKKSE